MLVVMPMQCCAFGCKNRAKKGCGKQFFRFPSARSDKKRRRKWILATQKEGWKPTVNSRICTDHFISGKPSERCNDPDYVPTIFNIKRSDPGQSSLLVFWEQIPANKDDVHNSHHTTLNQQNMNVTNDDTRISNHLPVLSENCEAKSTPAENTSPYFSSPKMKSLKGIISRREKSCTEASMDQHETQLHVASCTHTT